MGRFAQQYGPWAMVTGASSGLGEEFARQLAAEGLNLVLVARRLERLEALGAELSAAHGIDTRAVSADLSAPDFLDPLLADIEGIELGLLVNNAGFTMTGDLLDLDRAAQAKMVDLNCRAPLLLAHALAAPMRERGRGGVLFTASVMGFGGAAGWANYNATKAFDLVLAEGLAAELEPHGVDVLALCPGGTKTEFGAVGGADGYPGLVDRMYMATPPPVVRRGLRALGRRRIEVPMVYDKQARFLMWLFPRRIGTWVRGRIVQLLGD